MKHIVYEIFTIYGWVEVSRDDYYAHNGQKRWRWEQEENDG